MPRRRPRFFLSRSRTPSSGEDDQARATLSDRVRKEEIYAFVEIPADALDPGAPATMRYYSNHPAYRPLPAWIATTLNREIVNPRFRDAAIDRAVVTG